jgi:hypothetical protein
MGFLMSEMVSYAQTRVDSISELEGRCVRRNEGSTCRLLEAEPSTPGLPVISLSSLGHQVGLRILSLLLLRNIYGNASSLKVRLPPAPPGAQATRMLGGRS